MIFEVCNGYFMDYKISEKSNGMECVESRALQYEQIYLLYRSNRIRWTLYSHEVSYSNNEK
jgi:hypothetical protein